MDTLINSTRPEGEAFPSLQLAWLIYSISIATVFLIYISTNLTITHDIPIMPLDDAYIHFQYGRQLANGQPYIYNPGDEPTSGDTSLIYPIALAIGHLIGFHGLTLGYWAIGIGAISFLLSTWLIYLIVKEYSSGGLALSSGIAFILTGAITWHFLSGMETSLIILGVLWVFYTLSIRKLHLFAFALCFLAITRPEGSIMTITAIVIILLEAFITPKAMTFQITRRELLWLLLPIPATILHPFINIIFTGSPEATGGIAKSILSTLPFHPEAVVQRIIDNFTRMWREFFTGVEGYYYPIFIPIFAGLGWLGLLVRSQRRTLAIIFLGWFVVVSLAISTLDTAFWHFKRYQIPLIVLMFPLAAIGIQQIINFLAHYITLVVNWRTQLATFILSCLIFVIFFLPTWIEFLGLYRVNVQNIVTQPLAMAHWLHENTPEDSIVVVHDVGLIRYYSERYTLDMVGLTTKGAANSWHNGPGAVAEFIADYEPQPHYIAAYTTARGLNYLVDAGIYGELLESFPAIYDPADNVALAADFQGIYRYSERPNKHPFMTTQSGKWTKMTFTSKDNKFIWDNNPAAEYDLITDKINVANVVDEQDHDYQWSDQQHLFGFSTEVYEFELADCVWVNPLEFESSCYIRDGGRRINGKEMFTLTATPKQDAILITRIHAVAPGTIDIYVDDHFVDQKWIPVVPGQWVDIGTLIPADFVTNDKIDIRIHVNIPDGHYMPYYHWLFQGNYHFPTEAILQELDNPLNQIAVYQDGAFNLSFHHTVINHQLVAEVIVETNGNATGDYRFFLHLYDDPNSNPIAQYDGYLGAKGLPPGNWLPGIFGETLTVNLNNIEPGIYQLAIGFYNPHNFERLLPDSVAKTIILNTETRRIFMGNVEISDYE